MKLLVKQNSTSVKATVFIQDSSSTTGAGLTGLLFNSAGLTAYYYREGDATSTAITLATMTLGTWATGGFIVVDGTNMKGLYQIGLPNACFTALGSVAVYLQGATNMAPLVLEIQVVAFDPTSGTNLGLSTLPTAAAGAASGLLILGSNTGPLSISNGVTFTNSGGNGFTCSSTGANGSGLNVSGNGTAHGLLATGGATGNGISASGGASSGHGFSLSATLGHGILSQGTGTGNHGISAAGGTNGNGINATGNGTGDGIAGTGGATGRGMHLIGGATSGAGMRCEGTAGNANAWEAVGQGSGSGMSTSGGTTGNGLSAVGGSAASAGDGINASVLGTGVPIRGNLTGNITGNLSGSVGSVTAIVTANVTQWNSSAVAVPATAGIPDVNAKNINNVATTSVTTISANLGMTQPINFTGAGASALVKTDMQDIAGSPVNTASAQLGVNVVTWKGAALGSIAPDSVFLRSGTAQAGAASSITLDAGASAVNNFYQNEVVFIRSGTGAGQSALITTYNGTTKVATINGTWATNPDATSVFSLLPFGAISASVAGNVTVGGYAAGQDPATLVLDATAASHNTAGTIGADINLVGTNLDAKVSTRSAPATAQTIDFTTTLPVSPTAGTVGEALKFADTRLDAAISTRMATFTLPTNFAALGITAGGAVQVDGTSPLTESYTTGSFTLAQALYEIAQVVGQNSVAGTTITVQKRDKVTAAATFTLDSSTSPTSRTRAT